MHSWLERERIAGRQLLVWLEPRAARLMAMLTPENAAAARIVYDQAIEAGRKRYPTCKQEVVEVRTKGEQALALTRVTIDGVEQRGAFLLSSEGGRWLVAAELAQQCVMCAGKGVCAGCGGPGQMQGPHCYACGGRGGCDTCKGFGMVEGQ